MMTKRTPSVTRSTRYEAVLGELIGVIDAARRSSARTVNALLTMTYWEVGRRIVEEEQQGSSRAGYGKELLESLARDLTSRFGRGFGRNNLALMRAFYLVYPQQHSHIFRTPSGKSAVGASERSGSPFPLPWSHYVRLISLRTDGARQFYETEALRGGWSIRQLERQINSQFYERTAWSRNKPAMLTKGRKRRPEDEVTPEEEVKDPYVLEFLGLKDEYAGSEAEDTLIAKMELFLLELGDDFAFVGRQRRLRIGDEWYRVDLLFFHRGLRCLVIIDLKNGTFTHADSGQMHVYLNYAREHWMRPGENPPVGLILCAKKNEVLARYALEGLANKVMAAEYRTTLPDEEKIVAALTARGLAPASAPARSQSRETRS